MKYRVLFSIGIHHANLAGGGPTNQPTPAIDNFVEIIPDPETARRLKGYRIIQKKRPGRMQYIVQVKEDNKLLIPIKDTKFSFYLKIRRPEFLQFSRFLLANGMEMDLGNIMRGILFPLYTNEDDPDQEELVLKPDDSFNSTDHFTPLVASENLANGDAFFLKGTPIPGLVANDFEIKGLNGTNAPLNYNEANRFILLPIGQPHVGGTFWVEYRAIPPWAADTFGLVKISVPNGDDFTGAYLIKY